MAQGRKAEAKPKGDTPARGPGRPPLGRSDDARGRIIGVAEALFTERGFEGASMREIAAAADMQPASVYYHFPSKEELLWAVWQKGGVELVERLKAALAKKGDPWRRMEIACETHVAGLLDWRRANQILFVMPPWQYPETIRDRVVALRDEYEQLFVGLIDELPLKPAVDKHYLRLTIIGALSWSLFWFQKGRDTPTTIARRMLAMLRAGVDAGA